MVRPYIDTPALRKFFKVADSILEIGEGFVDKRMRELKAVAEKGIKPSGDTQGIVHAHYIFLLEKEKIACELD